VTVTVLTHLPTRSFAILRSGAASRDQPIGLYATNGFVDFTPITPPIDTLATDTVPALVEALSATTAYASIRSRTEPSTTYVTTDGGARWSLVEGLTDTADSACFHLPTMPQRSHCSAGSLAEH